jgi:hypothetical protein
MAGILVIICQNFCPTIFAYFSTMKNLLCVVEKEKFLSLSLALSLSRSLTLNSS